jgi:DNA-binding response OmpR family regulator
MRILIVDDDRVLADILSYTFRREGFETILAFDGRSALSLYAQQRPDLIVLDVNLPGLDGFSVCKELRRTSNTPIIMLTVRGEDEDVVHGLELGADDYISKPFSPRQLVARAHAVLRRSKHSITPAVHQVGNLILDPNNRTVRIANSEPVALSEQEYRLLEYLMMNVGKIMSVEGIFEQVWGAKGGTPEDLRQLIRRLRGKIELDPAKPKYIVNIPGKGYGLVLKEP